MWSIEGEESTGKTTLALSAPLPIVSFAFDIGSDRAVRGNMYKELFEGLEVRFVQYTRGQLPDTPKLWAGQDITVFELPQPIQLEQIRVVGAQDLWDYFIKALVDALTDTAIQTVVVDTMTLARRIKADAYLEGLQKNTERGQRIREQLIQIEWGKPNGSIRDIFNNAAGVRKNLVAVHHLTDEYREKMNAKGEVERVPTGRRILEGLAQTHRFVDIAVLLERQRTDVQGKLLKCGYNLKLTDQTVDNPTWDSVCDRISMSLGGRVEFPTRKATANKVS